MGHADVDSPEDGAEQQLAARIAFLMLDNQLHGATPFCEMGVGVRIFTTAKSVVNSAEFNADREREI